MKLLLDTHVLDWAQSEPDRLSPRVRDLLAEATPGDLAISDVSLSELARHLVAGRIVTRLSPMAWLEAVTKDVEVVPVSPAIALAAARLEWENRDPCDRHIVATAARLKLPLLTIDGKIHALRGVRGLRVIW